MSVWTYVGDTDGSAVWVECPGCSLLRALLVVVLTPEEARKFREQNGLTFATASVVPPADRPAAMERDASAEAMSVAMPFVSCTSCGYEGPYTFRDPEIDVYAMEAYLASVNAISGGPQ